MIYAEFYKSDLAGNLSPGVGDRSLVILDGRNNDAAWHSIASRECCARGFTAYQLRKGRGFTDSKAASGLIFPTCGSAKP